MQTWVGPNDDPERFAPARANAKLARFRLLRRPAFKPKTSRPTGFQFTPMFLTHSSRRSAARARNCQARVSADLSWSAKRPQTRGPSSHGVSPARSAAKGRRDGDRERRQRILDRLLRPAGIGAGHKELIWMPWRRQEWIARATTPSRRRRERGHRRRGQRCRPVYAIGGEGVEVLLRDGSIMCHRPAPLVPPAGRQGPQPVGRVFLPPSLGRRRRGRRDAGDPAGLAAVFRPRSSRRRRWCRTGV